MEERLDEVLMTESVGRGAEFEKRISLSLDPRFRPEKKILAAVEEEKKLSARP